ncbi:MAG: zinc ABC transporter substrate-binding protein [Gemmobacter sp.]|uniref:zinc ABC transporter substrate-binding protein n=1 Tax=Gemmobacter sp. TaxID=1898957 RepID=UPI001A452C5E|nr:zinc ABC transporter substrate-binding protein [Gemmobacter sp.]MBL8563305.1 zinc ABC transporter substrate-binding protein [Gemmobacter sp.]
MRYTISTILASLLASGAALAEVPKVVTDFAPTYGLVSMVMGDLGQPEILLDKGANAHEFQLKPSQSAALQEAGLVVWVGPRMSPWLERVLESFGSVPELRLLEVKGSHLQAFGAEAAHDHEGHDHEAEGHEDHDEHAEHGAEEGHADHEGHDQAEEGHEGHSHEGIDPHAWLDPANGAVWLDAIAAELSRLDPENAATYAANAAKGKALIAETDAQIAAQLKPVQGKPFVVFHDAYGYFAAHYGVTVAGAVALGDATSPGAAHLRDLQQKAGAEALCLFPEAGHDGKQVEQMAEATGVKLGAALDPEGAAVERDALIYPALLQGLAKTLADCLSQK